MTTLNPLGSRSGGDMLSQIKDTMNQGISEGKAKNALFKDFNSKMESLEFDSNIENAVHAFAKDLASKLAQA